MTPECHLGIAIGSSLTKQVSLHLFLRSDSGGLYLGIETGQCRRLKEFARAAKVESGTEKPSMRRIRLIIAPETKLCRHIRKIHLWTDKPEFSNLQRLREDQPKRQDSLKNCKSSG